MSVVLATVGVPPETGTAPLLTRMLPAASRLMVIVLAPLSPKTVSTPLVNVAVVAALAGELAASTAPAAPAVPMSSQRAARRRPWTIAASIVESFH